MSAPAFTTRTGRNYTLEDVRRLVKSRGIGDEQPIFEDVVQEVAIAVWKGRNADHAITDYWRKHGPRTRDGVEKITENTISLNAPARGNFSEGVEIIDTIASTDTAIDGIDFDSDGAREILKRLSPVEQYIIVSLANNVTAKQLAGEYNISKQRVYEIAYRARKRIAGELPPARRSPLKKRIGPYGRENWDTPHLRRQEIKMLQHIANGLDRKQIAEKEHYSTRMVDTYVACAIRRMGARDRTQAVAEALRRGLIQ